MRTILIVSNNTFYYQETMKVILQTQATMLWIMKAYHNVILIKCCKMISSVIFFGKAKSYCKIISCKIILCASNNDVMSSSNTVITSAAITTNNNNQELS